LTNSKLATQNSALPVNTDQLRRSAKAAWLGYYEENREWIARLGVWVNCDGQRRPSSGFILAALSALEPRLNQLLPLIVDLSNNPDRIVMALGLNFNPDEALAAIAHANRKPAEESVKLLPAGTKDLNLSPVQQQPKRYAEIDETCRGTRNNEEPWSDRP
jgi:hypothetical protein